MVAFLIKYRYWILVIVTLLIFLLGALAPRISINADSAQYFHKNDVDYTFYEYLKSEIKTEENLVLLAIENKESVFDTHFLMEVKNLSDSLRKIPDIAEVKGLMELSYPVNTLFGIMEFPYLNLNDSTDVSVYKKRIFNDFETTNLFISKEGNSLFLWIELAEGLDKDQVDGVMDTINDQRDSFSSLTTYLWGRKYMEYAFKQILLKEFEITIQWVFLFLILALLFIFRRPQAILFPTLIVFFSIIGFLGGMVVLKRPLGMMSSIFPTIILIVGVSDVVHLSTKYNIERHRGISPKEAARTALHEIGWTTFITSFTTAIGFFTLTVSPMKAMRDFGIESGIIVIYTYVLTIILLPAFFVNKKLKDVFTMGHYFDRLSRWVFHRTLSIQRHSSLVLYFSGALLVLSIVGIFFINTNSLEYIIPKDSALKKDHAFFEKYFGGSRVFELVIVAKEGQKLNQPEILQSLFNVHNYLTSHRQFQSVKSPVLYYKTVYKALYPSDRDLAKFKFEERAIKKYENVFDSYSQENYLFNNDKTVFKFRAQTNLMGMEDSENLNKEILSQVDQILDNELVYTRISGINFLMDLSQKKSIYSMLLGLLLAMIVVSITLGIIFKNVALTLLTLLLNFVPLVVTAGILGFTGLELRGEITLIFTIGFVIAVDDTIHLLSKFQWERRKGKSVEDAIYMAQKECGKAILATSIILVGGFLVLVKSTTVTIATLGIFTAIIVVIALFIDLVLAPILVQTWFRKYL